MKSATAHGAGVSHRVHESTPVVGGGVYSTRIRKPKRKNMASASAPSSSRGRARATDVKEQPTRDEPSTPDDESTLASSIAKTTMPSSNPSSGSPQAHSAKQAPVARPESEEGEANTEKSARGEEANDDQTDTPSKATSGKASTPIEPSASLVCKANPWKRDDIYAIAVLAATKTDNTLSELFSGSKTDLSRKVPGKSPADFHSIGKHFKAPLDEARVPFGPSYGVSSLIASLASELNDIDSRKDSLSKSSATLARIRAERQAMEKGNDKLIEENKALIEESGRSRAQCGELARRRAAAEAIISENKANTKRERAKQVKLRGTLGQAKLNELEARRRWDRMRLKVAALRGEMVTSTVDQLVYPVWRWTADVDKCFATREGDPVIAVREGISMKTKQAHDESVSGPDTAEKQDPMVGCFVKPDDSEMEEDAEETQLRLLRNRLAMCETEAKDWRETQESERRAVQLINAAKMRLEDELLRHKQAGSGKSGPGGSGRGSGKGSASNARSAAARMRAAARASLVALPELNAKKAVHKSRKGKPRKSLVPY